MTIQRKLDENCLAGFLVHRLAHEAVELQAEPKSPRFKQLALAHLEDATRVFRSYGFDKETIDRIVHRLIPNAAREYNTFMNFGVFSGDGATSCSLETVVEMIAERLTA